jgi:hypothetical protein
VLKLGESTIGELGMPTLEAVHIYDSYGGNEGHRGELYEVLKTLFATTRTRSFRTAIATNTPVLIPTIEASLPRFFALACLRRLFGRRTAAFLLRPRPVAEARSLRHRIKKNALRWLNRLNGVETIVFLPFEVEPRISSVATGWIFDPQFWDLHFPRVQQLTDQTGLLAAQLRSVAAGRLICCAIGRQDRAKGFDQFVRLYASNPELRENMLFVSGGAIDPDLATLIDQFEACGGLVINRNISREELLALYACSDLVWCSYAADYDQASGIFGRAMQCGIPTVVRKGSLLQRFCQMNAIDHIAFDENPAQFPVAGLPPKMPSQIAAEVASARGEASFCTLRQAFGLTRP